MYKKFVRPLLFLFSPETVHDFIVTLIRIPPVRYLLKMMYRYEHPSLERELFGIRFKNPVGLAAGFDKNAEICREMAGLGFGFIEIGTVTPRPQPGNPKPRIFRLVEDNALINRMGFNNIGADEVAFRLRNRGRDIIIGGNIGRNKTTPNELAVEDYVTCFEKLRDVVDFFIVNVSSPNTPNLRQLQEREPLKHVLETLKKRSAGSRPILLKIAPDVSDKQLNDIVEIVRETKIDGIVATNTTVNRDGLHLSAEKIRELGDGGLSGKPLAGRATEVIRYLRQKLEPGFPIIGVGGIHSPEDAVEKLEAGATLVELYTGFIYEGPGLVNKIKKYLAQKQT